MEAEFTLCVFPNCSAPSCGLLAESVCGLCACPATHQSNERKHQWNSPGLVLLGACPASVAFYPVGSVGKVIPQGKNHNWIPAFVFGGWGDVCVSLLLSLLFPRIGKKHLFPLFQNIVVFTFSFWNFHILCNSCARAGLALCWTAAFFLWPLLKFLINNRLSTAVQMMLLFLSVTSVFIPTNVGFALEGK